MQPVDRRGLKTVPVLDALRNEVDDRAAEKLERPPEDDGRRDPVDVVVAMDGYTFLARQCLLQADDGSFHVGERHRVVELIDRGAQEPAGRVDVREAAHAEQPGDGRMEVQRRREGRRLRIVTLEVMPDE